MLRSVLFLSLLAAAAAAPRQRCPPGYFFATGFTPANSFDPYADLRYYNRGKPYFSRAARQKCRSFPVYMSDMLNFGARFTRLCLDKDDNARYSFRTPDPCQGNKQVNGTMWLSTRPRRCAKAQLEPVPRVWEEATVSMNPSRQAPLRCPPAYRRAALPRDAPLLRAYLDSFFTQSVFIDKLIDRYSPNIYCDDAFRQIEYFDFQGCLKRPTAAADLPQVLARSKIRFQCWVRGADTPVYTIGLTVQGDHSIQCKPVVKLDWN